MERRGHDLVQGTLPKTEEDDKNDTVAVCYLSVSLVFSVPQLAGRTSNLSVKVQERANGGTQCPDLGSNTMSS